jgi:hypothetical protein
LRSTPSISQESACCLPASARCKFRC